MSTATSNACGFFLFAAGGLLRVAALLLRKTFFSPHLLRRCSPLRCAAKKEGSCCKFLRERRHRFAPWAGCDNGLPRPRCADNFRASSKAPSARSLVSLAR